MNLVISLRSEIFKTKRTAVFYFTLISAAIVPVIFLLNVLGDDLDSTKKDPLNMIFKLLSDMNGVAFFPWFVILICTLLPQIEYRNNTWKQVFTSPQPKLNVLTAKFINIHLLMLLFLVSTHLFMFLAIALANAIDPTIGLYKNPLDGQVVCFSERSKYVCNGACSFCHPFLAWDSF
jgi:lantibiotic transport system permease protein